MIGAAMKIHERSVSVIGGADGPAVIYVAGIVVNHDKVDLKKYQWIHEV